MSLRRRLTLQPDALLNMAIGLDVLHAGVGHHLCDLLFECHDLVPRKARKNEASGSEGNASLGPEVRSLEVRTSGPSPLGLHVVFLDDELAEGGGQHREGMDTEGTLVDIQRNLDVHAQDAVLDGTVPEDVDGASAKDGLHGLVSLFDPMKLFYHDLGRRIPRSCNDPWTCNNSLSGNRKGSQRSPVFVTSYF